MKLHNATGMFAMLFAMLIILLTFASAFADNDAAVDEKESIDSGDSPGTDAEVPPEKLEYTKGSLCKYCDYCKFCKLCDADCPCETSSTKPNCKMCKYCKYCYLCSALCDTVCKPGGFLDRASAAIVNALPSYNKEEIDDDIDSVKHWIDRKKDEL